MITPRATLSRTFMVAALALLASACEDGPTLPEVVGDPSVTAEGAAAAALEQGAIETRAALAEGVSRLPAGTLPAGRDTVAGAPRRPGMDQERRAHLAVALGAEGVALAERLLEGTDPSAEQLRHLDHAHDLQRRAGAALDEGRLEAAVELAEAARIEALKAVVLPRGISDPEARAIHDLAADLLAQARAAIGAGGSDVERQLLALSVRFFEAGSASLAQGTLRGVVALWQSACLSSFLIG